MSSGYLGLALTVAHPRAAGNKEARTAIGQMSYPDSSDHGPRLTTACPGNGESFGRGGILRAGRATRKGATVDTGTVPGVGLTGTERPVRYRSPRVYPTRTTALEKALSNELANLIARLFIQRRDARAIQIVDSHGEPMYMPELKYRPDGPRLPWTRDALLEHLAGTKTYGHYLLDDEDHVKLVAFDVDLNKTGTVFVDDDTTRYTDVDDLRAYWRDRTSPGRRYLKLAMNLLAQELTFALDELGIPWAVQYSGSKGFHVYGFTGPLNAALAREAAKIVMDSLALWESTKGDNFFQFSGEENWALYKNFSIEVFPKQDSLDGKDLGNLMRLPLGRNLKSKDPSFFMDIENISDNPYELHPIKDPVELLTKIAGRMG